MTPEQAAFLKEFFLAALRQESETTRRVMAAVPAEQCGYRPHTNSRSALELSWHIASAEVWFLDSIFQGRFETGGGAGVPAELKTPADVLAWYGQHLPGNIEKVSRLSGDYLAPPVTFFQVQFPAAVYLQFLLAHTIHHRGQLSAYLRPMGAKVPRIYAGSFDEPYERPARA